MARMPCALPWLMQVRPWRWCVKSGMLQNAIASNSCCVCVAIWAASPHSTTLLQLLCSAAAGDTMDDANFEHTTANGAILRLTKELTWIGGFAAHCWPSWVEEALHPLCCCTHISQPTFPEQSVHCADVLTCFPCSLPFAEETLAAADSLRDEPPTSFIDRVFDNEMNIAVRFGSVHDLAEWLVGGSCIFPNPQGTERRHATD